MRIDVIGEIWRSHANGQVYSIGGLSPTLCVGAHSGVSPKILLMEETMSERTLLNRYVRYIYRKMKMEIGVQETREQALRIFAITTPERARVRKEEADMIESDVVEKLLSLAAEWKIPTAGFLRGAITRQMDSEKLEQMLLDLTPIRVRIRKLTPVECLRLMDMHEPDIEKLSSSGLSNSALYKLAGNSIVCACLEGIFTQMFRKDSDKLF